MDRPNHNGVELNMRWLSTIAVVLLLVSVPTDCQRDYVFDASDATGWIGFSDAVARVRFEGHRAGPSDEEGLTRHTATVLGIVKSHELFPLPPGPVEIIERRGFMYTEDGHWPCWNNERPLPVGSEAMVFVRWDRQWRAFILGTVAFVRSRERAMRILGSRRLCELNET
jgi:hypothetical protein